jgi:hypothetical protein
MLEIYSEICYFICWLLVAAVGNACLHFKKLNLNAITECLQETSGCVGEGNGVTRMGYGNAKLQSYSGSYEFHPEGDSFSTPEAS